jgi:hypothetical protein
LQVLQSLRARRYDDDQVDRVAMLNDGTPCAQAGQGFRRRWWCAGSDITVMPQTRFNLPAMERIQVANLASHDVWV